MSKKIIVGDEPPMLIQVGNLWFSPENLQRLIEIVRLNVPNGVQIIEDLTYELGIHSTVPVSATEIRGGSSPQTISMSTRLSNHWLWNENRPTGSESS